MLLSDEDSFYKEASLIVLEPILQFEFKGKYNFVMMAAPLPCHAQSCVVIIVLKIVWQDNKICIKSE